MNSFISGRIRASSFFFIRRRRFISFFMIFCRQSASLLLLRKIARAAGRLVMPAENCALRGYRFFFLPSFFAYVASYIRNKFRVRFNKRERAELKRGRGGERRGGAKGRRPKKISQSRNSSRNRIPLKNRASRKKRFSVSCFFFFFFAECLFLETISSPMRFVAREFVISCCAEMTSMA